MLYFAVDSGTTNSRVWLMRDREVLAKKRVSVGVRNTAIDGNNRALVNRYPGDYLRADTREATRTNGLRS